MKSSYFLKSGRDGSGGVNDWSYSEKLGDLDECNGHFGKTPDFPKGTYHYHSTLKNGLGDLGFPYFLGCYHGKVITGSVNSNLTQQGPPQEGQIGPPNGSQKCHQPEGEQFPSIEVRRCPPPNGQKELPQGGQMGPPPQGGQMGPSRGGFNMGGGMQQGGFNMGGGMQQGGFGNIPNPFP